VKQVFPIVPPSGNASFIALALIGALLIGLVALFAYIAWSTRHVQFEVSSEGLKITGDLYGRTIPAADLIAGEARGIDLAAEPGYRPRWRTNGVGLPGYISGWFRLVNKEKALAFVTDRTRIVRIPTRKGYSVLLSVADPQQFLSALNTAVH
jgi:hypothetical protein